MDDEWQAFLKTVTKRGTTPAAAPKMPKMPLPTGATPTAAIPAYTNPHWRASALPILSNTAQRQSGCCPSVPKKTFQALANGQCAPQEVLDLHGLREGDAWLRLHHFLSQAARTEHGNTPVHVVLVIHGKGRGEGPDKNMGVIKSQMPAQLARHPAVLAFHTAPPAMGGMGAMLVLLKNH